MEETLKIGQIARPHGVKGELRVIPLTDDPSRFKKLKTALIDGENYRVLSVKVASDCVCIAFSGIPDRTTAETFRGKFISVDRKDAVPLEENTFFIADVIGADVVDENGEFLCRVTDVTPSKTDVFTGVTEDGKTVRFPFLKDLLIFADLQQNRITVSRKRYGEITCYED